VKAVVPRHRQPQQGVETRDGVDFGVIHVEQTSRPWLALGDAVNSPATQIGISAVVRIHRRIRIGMDDHVNWRRRAQRIVQRAECARHRPVLVVAVVMRAVARKKRVTRVRLEHAKFRVRPREAKLAIGDGWYRLVARRLPLGGSYDRFRIADRRLAELRDALRRGPGGPDSRNAHEHSAPAKKFAQNPCPLCLIRQFTNSHRQFLGSGRSHSL